MKHREYVLEETDAILRSSDFQGWISETGDYTYPTLTVVLSGYNREVVEKQQVSEGFNLLVSPVCHQSFEFRHGVLKLPLLGRLVDVREKPGHQRQTVVDVVWQRVARKPDTVESKPPGTAEFPYQT